MFLSISWHSQRVDTIFYVYVEDSIKVFERNRRTSGIKPTEIEIIHDSSPWGRSQEFLEGSSNSSRISGTMGGRQRKFG